LLLVTSCLLLQLVLFLQKHLCLSDPNWIHTVCCVLFVCSVLCNVKIEHLLVMINRVIRLLPLFCFTVKDTVSSPFKRIFISVVLHFSVFRFSCNRRMDKHGVRLGFLLLFLQRKLKKKKTLLYTWTVNYLLLITRDSATFLEKGDNPINNLIGHIIIITS